MVRNLNSKNRDIYRDLGRNLCKNPVMVGCQLFFEFRASDPPFYGLSFYFFIFSAKLCK